MRARDQLWTLTQTVTAICITSGCVTTTMVTRLAPPQLPLPRTTESLGIHQFTDDEGGAIQAAVSARLVSNGGFTVVDPANRTIAVATVSAGRDGNGDGRPRIGEMITPDAIVRGNVQRADFAESTESHDETCERKKKDGKSEQYACVRRIRRASAGYTVNISVFETETNRLLVSKQMDADHSAKTESTEGAPDPIDGGALLRQCRQDIADDFATAITWHEVREKVVLEDDGDLPELAMGNRFAKKGQWKDALERYQQALAKANQNNATLEPETIGRANYDVALALAVSEADFDTALELLSTAINLYPDDDWIDLQVRIQRWKHDYELLLEHDQALSAYSSTGGP